jgi:hypothetical protein
MMAQKSILTAFRKQQHNVHVLRKLKQFGNYWPRATEEKHEKNLSQGSWSKGPILN